MRKMAGHWTEGCGKNTNLCSLLNHWFQLSHVCHKSLIHLQSNSGCFLGISLLILTGHCQAWAFATSRLFEGLEPDSSPNQGPNLTAKCAMLTSSTQLVQWLSKPETISFRWSIYWGSKHITGFCLWFPTDSETDHKSCRMVISAYLLIHSVPTWKLLESHWKSLKAYWHDALFLLFLMNNNQFEWRPNSHTNSRPKCIIR